MDDFIGAETAEWLVGIGYDPGLNLVRRLLRRPKLGDLRALCNAVDAVLRRDGTIVQNIEWWQDEPHTGTSSAHPI